MPKRHAMLNSKEDGSEEVFVTARDSCTIQTKTCSCGEQTIISVKSKHHMSVPKPTTLCNQTVSPVVAAPDADVGLLAV